MAAKHLPQVLDARVIVRRQTIVYGAEKAQVGGETRGARVSDPRRRGNRILVHGNSSYGVGRPRPGREPSGVLSWLSANSPMYVPAQALDEAVYTRLFPLVRSRAEKTNRQK